MFFQSNRLTYKEEIMTKNSEQITTQSGSPGIDESAIPTVDNKFDLDSLRLSQNFADSVGVKRMLITVPVRKPNRQDFFRVRPEPEYCLETVILELKEERMSYLVDRSIWADIPGELVPKAIFTCLTRLGVLFLWPVRLPGEDGRQDHWSRSALTAAEMGKARWVRVAANLSLGAYEVFSASSDLQEPDWPPVSFQEILRIAFRDQYIDSIDHPVLRRLRGAA